jgi:hypothetical protein
MRAMFPSRSVQPSLNADADIEMSGSVGSRRLQVGDFPMISSFGRRSLALGLAGTIALAAAVPASAMPLAHGLRASAVPSQVEHVRWRRGAWIGAGIATGLILGGIAASRPYYGYPYYAGPAYAYPAPVYEDVEPVYAPPPRAYAQPVPDGGVRQCFVTTNQDRGLGYWRPC